jgi:hypothetical protein
LSFVSQGCILANGDGRGAIAAIAVVAVGFAAGGMDEAAIAGNRINTRGAASISPIGAECASDVVDASDARLRRRGLMDGAVFVIGFAFLWRCGYRLAEFRP